MDKYTPRISITIDEETYFLLRRYLPHGYKTYVLGKLIDDFAKKFAGLSPRKERGF